MNSTLEDTDGLNATIAYKPIRPFWKLTVGTSLLALTLDTVFSTDAECVNVRSSVFTRMRHAMIYAVPIVFYVAYVYYKVATAKTRRQTLTYRVGFRDTGTLMKYVVQAAISFIPYLEFYTCLLADIYCITHFARNVCIAATVLLLALARHTVELYSIDQP